MLVLALRRAGLEGRAVASIERSEARALMGTDAPLLQYTRLFSSSLRSSHTFTFFISKSRRALPESGAVAFGACFTTGVKLGTLNFPGRTFRLYGLSAMLLLLFCRRAFFFLFFG